MAKAGNAAGGKRKPAGKKKASGKQRAQGARGNAPEYELLEGKHALTEAMNARVPIARIYASDAMWRDKRMAKLLERAAKRGIDVVRVDAEKLDEHSEHGAHQGVIAQVRPYAYGTIEHLLKAAQGKENALVVMCDHITDAGNFGAICRSAEVVGATGVLVPNKRQARVNATTYKTSAGAVAHLPVCMEPNLARCAERFKEEGFWVVGASEHAETVLWDANLSGRIVLVMGSESEGISPIMLKNCDVLVKLPQAGTVESLNVAQATTAMAYEWLRQSRQKQR